MGSGLPIVESPVLLSLFDVNLCMGAREKDVLLNRKRFDVLFRSG